MITWNRPFPPSTLRQIEEYETLIRASLPPDYKRYLLSDNGGYPCGNMEFTIPSLCGEQALIMLGSLYGNGRRGGGLDLITAYEREESPEGYVPIGEDPGGNLLLLELSTGGVLYWERDGILLDQIGEDLFPVAEGINQFVASLREYSGPT